MTGSSMTGSSMTGSASEEVHVPFKQDNVVPGTLDSNRLIAEHLLLVSMGMVLDGANRFKVRAFEDAAESVALSSADLRYVDPTTISGVGASVAEVIRDFVARGTSARYEDLSSRHPMEALSMTKVSSIGPKTALKYYAEGIRNFAELVIAANTPGRLKDKVRDAVLFAVKKERVPHAEAVALASAVFAELRNQAPVQMMALANHMVCGSIRRKAVDSKDVDIVGSVMHEEGRDAILDEFVKIGTKISRGENRASIRFTHNGRTMQVDLWLVYPESYGSALNYATGSKDHCVAVRALARSRGQLVNEYGIWKQNAAGEAGERLGGADERDLYRVLRLPYVESEDRTGDLPASLQD
jgi:DNA polymerase (family X)